MPAKPFVKWAGGKTQLLEILRQKYPHRIEKYCEPFVGGGAVLFDVLNTFRRYSNPSRGKMPFIFLIKMIYSEYVQKDSL